MPEPRTILREIFQTSIEAVEPRRAVLAHCRVADGMFMVGERRFAMDPGGRIIVVGSGKGSAAMAQAVEELLGDRISDGVVVVKYGHTAPLKRIRLVESGHPVPDAAGEAGATALMQALSGLTERDLVIACMSGGASSLIPSPSPGLTLADKQAVTRVLLASGADVHVVNAVRKHLSQLKGGQLARRAAPAAVACLVLSDVVGDDLSTIGSGPFFPDHSSYAEVLAHLDRLALRPRLPEVVVRLLERGAAGEIADTPKPGDPCFARVHHHLVGNNRQAMLAACNAASARGYRPLVLAQPMVGEARVAAAALIERARLIAHTGEKACLVAGGETTVTLSGAVGRGGRNQEVALTCATILDGGEDIAVLAGGTDGNDGPTDAAGAFCDGTTVARARARGLGLDASHHLMSHDAYPFFAALGDLIMTGPTGTNVMDITLALIEPR
jgi:hydroxypyruvate reductase